MSYASPIETNTFTSGPRDKLRDTLRERSHERYIAVSEMPLVIEPQADADEHGGHQECIFVNAIYVDTSEDTLITGVVARGRSRTG